MILAIENREISLCKPAACLCSLIHSFLPHMFIRYDYVLGTADVMTAKTGPVWSGYFWQVSRHIGVPRISLILWYVSQRGIFHRTCCILVNVLNRTQNDLTHSQAPLISRRMILGTYLPNPCHSQFPFSVEGHMGLWWGWKELLHVECSDHHLAQICCCFYSFLKIWK